VSADFVIDYPDLGKRIKNKPSIPDFKRINHAIVPSKKNAVMANAINAILATRKYYVRKIAHTNHLQRPKRQKK